jgi:hypothetical protein
VLAKLREEQKDILARYVLSGFYFMGFYFMGSFSSSVT